MTIVAAGRASVSVIPRNFRLLVTRVAPSQTRPISAIANGCGSSRNVTTIAPTAMNGR